MPVWPFNFNVTSLASFLCALAAAPPGGLAGPSLGDSCAQWSRPPSESPRSESRSDSLWHPGAGPSRWLQLSLMLASEAPVTVTPALRTLSFKLPRPRLGLYKYKYNLSES